MVIVAVDDRSLREYRDVPLAFWGPYFATALGVLREAGARVIGIDFLFSVSAEAWLKRLAVQESDVSRTYDIPFRKELNSGRVVLIANAALNRFGESELLLPVENYLYALPGGLADVGLSNFYLDGDEVVRRYLPSLLEEGSVPGLTFAALLAARASGPDLEHSGKPMGPANPSSPLSPRRIGYVGPPGTFPRVSFRDLLVPRPGPDATTMALLKDKVVIIGDEHTGSNDVHSTPYVRRFFHDRAAAMSGPEIHANIVETILSGRHPRSPSPPVGAIWFASIVLLAALWFVRSRPLGGLVFLCVLCLAICGIAYLSFSADLVLPVANTQVALGLCYLGSLGMRLTGEERARARLQAAISPYVSDAMVTKLLSCPRLPDLGGETLEVTVLFSDIRSFTTISERLTPQEVVEMLNEYYGRACVPILEQGGMVDKFMGDAVMAIFGAPVPQPDNAGRALNAALSMVEIAQDFQDWIRRRFPERDLPRFRIGIGVHTGDAVVGNIGSKRRMTYTAIGDTVNVASRLESMTKTLGWAIVASEATVGAAGSHVTVGSRQKVKPPGRTGEIEVMEVMRTSPGKKKGGGR